MTSVLAMLATLAAPFGFLGLVLLPIALIVVRAHQRWRFTVGAHAVEVWNYAFHERVLVDGEPVSGTRVAGDWMTSADHRVTLGAAGTLDIHIFVDGGRPACRASIEGRPVFDSRALLAPVTPPALPPFPPLDPRLAAAGVLLEALGRGSDPRLAEASRELGEALQAAFRGLEAAKEQAAAHAALGGEAGALAALVEGREREVEALLTALRDLHVAATSTTLPERLLPPRVREIVDRVNAEREVATIDPDRPATPPSRARERA